jgi:uncharacterized protein YggE
VAGAIVLGGWLLREQAAAQGRAAPAREKDPPTLNTSGIATIRVKPDAARVYFKVETYAARIEDARATNGQQVKKVLDAVNALKLEKLKMKSANLNVSLVTDRRQGIELPRVLGYHITHTFTVLVEDEDAVKLAEGAGKVLDSALANGATGVDQIQFFKKDLEGIRRTALTKAVEDALANARALAAGANKTVTEVATIQGQPQYAYSDFRQQNTMSPGSGGEGATPLVAGDLEITCTVHIVCRF